VYDLFPPDLLHTLHGGAVRYTCVWTLEIIKVRPAVHRAWLETEEAMVLILKCDAQLSQVLHGQNKVLELHEQLLACRHGAATDGEFDLAVPSNVGNCD